VTVRVLGKSRLASSRLMRLLLALLGWPEQRLANLMRERRRAGFKDLADLQERLCLPASSVEALIGRVSFGSRRAGPSLPLP